ncbi:MAG: cadherin-like domain-containing protein [Chloroflexi bacterium]|nr:cadherin-like domain-containing protein [Chloroflexota bacterium]
MMKNKWFTTIIGLLLIIGMASVALGLVNGRGRRGVTASTVTLVQTAQNQPAQSSAAQLVGNYSGAIKLNVTVGGVYSDTLATPPAPGAGTPTPPDLGSIDLSLQLSQADNALTGYVSLDKTLVYSVEHTLGAGAASVKIGPYLNGSFDGVNLTVQSEKVALIVSGRTVQRQFRLTGTSTASDGGQISGEYRETLWGYTSVPVTVIGSFTLQRPGFGSNVPVTSSQAPDAGADTATTAQGAAITLNVLANDSVANGGALIITSVSKPQFGTATTNGQTVTYTPNTNFVGNDNFSYFVSDGKGGTATGSVSITVNGPGGTSQAPTAANDTATTASGNAVTIDVLANDGNPNGDLLTITIDGPPSHGTAAVNNGKLLYTPNAGFTGTDSLTYIISDGKGGTATATVTITVTPGSQSTGRALYLPLIRR